MSREDDPRRVCIRCGDSGVLRPSWDWCACVLGTIHRQQFARRTAGVALDFTGFYEQRALPFFRRDNDWVPSE